MKTPVLRTLLLCLLGLLFAPSAEGQFYYGIRQEYGKNRVQYDEFDWVFYRMDAFDVYFYRGNEELAQNVVRLTHENLPQIENYLDAPLNERVQILVFNNLSDLKQSNVNSNDEEDFNTGGVTRVSGRRLFVYFDGSYRNLERTLRMGLAEVVISNLLYGSFTQSLANSALLNLPAWYLEGLISYVGSEWSADLDVQVRDGFYSGKYDHINTLTQLDARYAGHSFWRFVAKTYGDKIIRNIVYMALVNRDIESGFIYILNKELEQMTQDWQAFYAEQYGLADLKKRELPEPFLKSSRRYQITDLSLSPDGTKMVYVDRRFSRYRIYLYDLREDKKKRIYTGGYRIAQNTDYSYPIIAWHPNGDLLTFFTEKQGATFMNVYQVEDEELQSKPFYRFDKMVSVSYSPDGKDLLVAANKDGRSDIFVYTVLNTKIKRITDDPYDDLNPSFVNGDRRIVWSSNRPHDTLYATNEAFVQTGKYDLFLTDNRELLQDTLVAWRLTQSPDADELMPREVGQGRIAFLSDRSGTRSEHLIKVDSAIAYVDTITHYDYFFKEYLPNEERFSLVDRVRSPQEEKAYSLFLQDGRSRIYRSEWSDPLKVELDPIEVQASSPNPVQGPSSESESEQAEPEPENAVIPLYYPGQDRSRMAVNINNYDFGKEVGKPKQKDPADGLQALVPQMLPEVNASREDSIDISPVRNYFLSFFKDDFTVRFDNMFTNPQYQPFTGFVSSDLLNQGFNSNFKVGAMDLMHDYRLVAAVRTTFQPLPGTSLTPNAEFFVGLSDKGKRWDKDYVYSRRSQVQFLALNNYRRYINNEFNYKVRYPFNPVSAIEMSAGYRIDEDIRLATDFNQLGDPINYTDYGILRAAYIYDNSRKIGLNLRAGLRYKVFTEYYRNLTKSNTGLHTLGVDARHYLVLHRNMIWANRLAAGTSFGPEKLIHIMGGVDNEFSPRLDRSTPIATENNYVFQTLVTNMRGFFQNARNGNQFAVLNSELRWPFVSYFANRPLRNDFLNNLMVVGFADVGTAWNGPSPWDPENAINTRTVPLGSGGQIVLDSQKDPIIFGSGFGLRTRLFGYFVRVDYAWGIEDGIVLDPLLYFSLSTDF